MPNKTINQNQKTKKKMKTLTKEESLKALQIAIEKEAQQKGKKALFHIAKRNETFKIVSFEEMKDEIGNTTRNWINFNYISKLAGENITLSASMSLFKKNLYKDKEAKVILPTTNKGLLGTIAAKEAFENGKEIKPIITANCFVKEYDKDNNVIIKESEELTFIIE